MTPPRDLRDLIDGDDLSADELARLQKVHDLLVAAGPPPELPPALAEAPSVGGKVTSLLSRRRGRVALLLAAAIAAAAFGVGYLVAATGNGFDVQRAIPMRGTAAAPAALATVQLGNRDVVGNWSLRVRVTGLPEQPQPNYYELWLTRNGKPVVTCGTFRVHGGTTVVHLNAPYRFKRFDHWVVTEWHPGLHGPGKVLMTSGPASV